MKYCDSCHTTYPTEFSTCPKDQAVLRSVADLADGMVLRGKYQVLEKIGVGGMAAVYRVRHQYLQEDVAIKVVSGRLAEDQAFVDRFKTEAVITRKLRHPNAVRVDDLDTTDDGRPFIVMEYVRGESLRQLLKKNGWLPAARAAGIARQTALALGAAHQLGIVHRDIKPENILLVPQPDGGDLVKVLDFGIAKVRKGSFDLGPGYTPTQTGLVLGTPQYLSPEQARGKQDQAEVDGRADLYALGIVLYEMLTGRVPFAAETPFDLLVQHIQTPPMPPHLVDAGLSISPAMSALVMKALEKDPAQRFQTGEEMAAALEHPQASAQAEASAHAFSTTALAAAAGMASAAAAPGAPAAHPECASPAEYPRTVAVNATPDTSVPLTKNAAQPATLAPPATTARKRGHRTWMLVGISAGAVIIVLGIVLGLRVGQSSAPAAGSSAPAVAEKTYSTAPPRPYTNVRRTPPAAPSASRHRPQPAPSPRDVSAMDHVRAQELVAQGYRSLQQRDFDGARDAFEEALEIEPGNPAAQKGLKTATTAQTVQGIAGVLRH